MSVSCLPAMALAAGPALLLGGCSCLGPASTHRGETQVAPLTANELVQSDERKLSFKREFGKIVGRLDLLAGVLTEKYRRAVISYVQNLAGASFLQFLPVR